MAQTDETRKFALMVLLALWVAAWGYSLVPLFSEPEGVGGDPVVEAFARGLNRMKGFLGWQGIAGMIALALWGVGRGLPKGSGARRISAVPLGITVAVLSALIGAVLWP